MQHDLATEQRILNAAHRVFQSRGMHGARMQDIADKAGINKALLHYYFRSKEQLFDSVFQEAVQKFLHAVFGIWQTDAAFESKLHRFVASYLDLLMQNPFLPAFILNELHQNPKHLQSVMMKKGAASLAKLVLAQIQEELQRHRTKSVEAKQVLVNVLALCVFPFAARPLVTSVMGVGEKEFKGFIEKRKTLIPQLILQSIKQA